MIQVQEEDFDVTEVLKSIRGDSKNIGAIVSFIGLVREFSEDQAIQSMTLEHYPGMTEATLEEIASRALDRWKLQNVAIIHRIGKLQAGDNIVLVATTSAHRKDAFEAAQFIMDFLKTDAPFWKKEHTDKGDRWVTFRDKDVEAKKRWQSDSG